jgi:hypothetical protein
MQNAKLIERFFLKGGLGCILGEQDDRIRSYNSTDFLDLSPSLRKIAESDA